MTYVLTVLPLLVFPLLVINALGADAGAAYFISFQIVTLLHAVILAVANAGYAEGERATTGRHHVVRKSGLTLLVVLGGAGAVVMWPLAPYFLMIFGDHYVDEGTWTLRVLAFATVGAAFNYWGAIRLRLASHLPAMIGVQVLSTAVMLVLAGALASHGTVWVAAAWGIGHAVGGVAGYVASVTIARFPDDAPVVAGARARRGAMNRLRNLAVATILRAAARDPPAAVARRAAVAVGRGRGLPGDRGQRPRGRPRPARAVRRPRRLAPRPRRRVPAEVARAGRPTGMVLVPKASLPRPRGPTSAPRRCCSPTASTAARSPSPRKPIVNLWHGDGPKDVRPENGVGGLIASTWFVGSTRLFSGYQAAAFGVPDDHVLLTGNPRTDQLWRPVDPEQPRPARHHRRLRGVDADLPSHARAVGAMREQSELAADADDGHAELGGAARRAARARASSWSSSRTRWTPRSAAGTAPSRSPTPTCSAPA